MRHGAGGSEVLLRSQTNTAAKIMDEMRLVEIPMSKSLICCIGRGVNHQSPYSFLESNKAFDFVGGLAGKRLASTFKLTSSKA